MLSQRGDGRQGFTAGPLISTDPLAEVSFYPARWQLAFPWRHIVIIPSACQTLQAVYSHCFDYYYLY